jgi:FtsX-like permease family
VRRRSAGIAWYRFLVTWRSRRGAYLSVVLLVGLAGGIAMAATAGARRTQSAFPAYLAATRASDLQVEAYVLGTGSSDLSGELAGIPQVTHVAEAPSLFVAPLGPDGRPEPAFVTGALSSELDIVGSVNGEYFSRDRVAVVKGRMADPASTSQMVASAQAARLAGWHVGETITFGAFPFTALSSAGYDPLTAKPALHFSATLVGLVVFASQVVNDDVDRYPALVLMTPALTHRLRASEAYPTYGLKLRHGSADVPAVEREVIGLLPRGTIYDFHLTSVAEGEVERATKPETIALAVFGAIAALVALVIGGQAVSRGLWTERDDLDVMRALGAGPVTLAWSAMLGLLGAVLAGAILAVAVAVSLSPLAPLGRVRQVEPSPGIAVDWTVLGAGFLVVVAGLGVLTVVLTYRRVWRRHPGRHDEPAEQGSRLVNTAAGAGLPAPLVAGLRFSLERGSGRSAVPVRSALFGAVLAVTVVVTTLTFASGLRTLVSHPSLYGWNWGYAINGQGGSDIPPAALARLSRDPAVAAWTGYDYANIEIDGDTVPALVAQNAAEVGPTILSGHTVEGKDQIVIGSATLAALHKKLGDTVMAGYGSPKDAPVYVPPTPMKIVGTATLPAVGSSGALHTSMGTGAMISYVVEPPAFQRFLDHADANLSGPDLAVVRFRKGVPTASGVASLWEVANDATKVMNGDPQGTGDVYQVIGVQRPAEIVNYQSTGATPTILATGLAAGAVVALGLTLVASVRRRRRDLAMLKTLGFTRRQLAAAVAWQASVAALTGVLIGTPVGIALGRWTWDTFAQAIYAVPQASVPVVDIVVVAVGALLLANLAAAVPGRVAARTPTALVLRAE